jgi:hypothetical protein
LTVSTFRPSRLLCSHGSCAKIHAFEHTQRPGCFGDPNTPSPLAINPTPRRNTLRNRQRGHRQGKPSLPHVWPPHRSVLLLVLKCSDPARHPRWPDVPPRSAASWYETFTPPLRLIFHPVSRLHPARPVGTVKPAPPLKLRCSVTCALQIDERAIARRMDSDSYLDCSFRTVRSDFDQRFALLFLLVEDSVSIPCVITFRSKAMPFSVLALRPRWVDNREDSASEVVTEY